MSSNNNENQYILNDKYIIIEKLGKGKFGEVYKGKDIHTNEPVAIKLEHYNTPKTSPYSKYSTKQGVIAVLKHETQILNFLHNRRCRNIPYIYWFGVQSTIPALVMPYYEYSLFDLFTQSVITHTKYKHSTLYPEWRPEEIIRNIIRILQHIHTSGVVHRDIKPHNFMVKNRELVLIDFGMATFYLDQTNRHITEPDDTKEHLLGTQKYISINVHYGKEYTRRDDLISVGYLYLFLRNWLFWDRVYIPQDVVYKNTICIHDNYPETHISHPKNVCFRMAKELSNIEKCVGDVSDKKHDNPNSTLRQVRSEALANRRTKDLEDCPEMVYHRMIMEYLRYTYALGFNETPNYDLMTRLFAST